VQDVDEEGGRGGGQDEAVRDLAIERIVVKSWCCCVAETYPYELEISKAKGILGSFCDVVWIIELS
jgi:hypothetical protein